jgi:general stress protein YciG
MSAGLGREDESGQMVFTEAEFQLLRQRKKLSPSEAGKIGGRAVARSKPKGFFQMIGKEGGTTTKRRLGHDHYQRIGQKGGQKSSELRLAREDV